MKEKTGSPAAVSQAGTNAAMPSTGTTRCSSTLNSWRRRRRKYAMQVMLAMM